MTGHGAPRLPTLPWERGLKAGVSSWTERILQHLGAHREFSDSILGDLAEQRANLTIVYGAAAAQRWYVREALRSAPHLLWNAVQYGGPLGRARVAAILAVVALAPVAILAANLFSDGPPARLVIGTSGTTADLIMNSREPRQLATTVFDADGHTLPSTGVRYRWISGTPAKVTPGGIVTCTQPGDASVRVSLGAVATTTLLRCRPVRDVRAPDVLALVVGDPAQRVDVEALDADGHPVTLLAGSMSAGDSTIVTLDGQRVRARAAGTTWVTTRIGDGESDTRVHVYERATSPEAIRRGQHLAVSVRLSTGEMHEWRLPASRERYFMRMIPDPSAESMLRIAIVGANCVPWFDARSFQCAAPHGATVFTYRAASAGPARPSSGRLAIWREP